MLHRVLIKVLNFNGINKGDWLIDWRKFNQQI